MFNFQKLFAGILIFLNWCPYFTILKKQVSSVIGENRAERKKLDALISCPTQIFFLCLLVDWSMEMKSPKHWPELFPLVLATSLFLTWEFSYLLGFFLIFRVMHPDLYLSSCTAQGHCSPGGSWAPFGSTCSMAGVWSPLSISKHHHLVAHVHNCCFPCLGYFCRSTGISSGFTFFLP